VSTAFQPPSSLATARQAERLDGWKSIAAYLKRDRTTVIRWTRERGLPVYRLPGGRTATVFALKHELDRWAGMPEVRSEPVPAPPAAIEAPAAARSRRWIAALAVAAMAIGVPATFLLRDALAAGSVEARKPALAPPHDPAIAARFLTARDLIAERRADGLERAIAELEIVVRAAPDYPLGHASLAEALVLSREFGMRRDAEAFAQARSEARAAVRLEPDLAIGHRLLGFIAYWADHDFAEADAQFRRALARDPGDALTHFWYGNVLADTGDHPAALRALNRARLLQPGSVAIRTDLAWAQWAAGQDAVAMATLRDIEKSYPDFAVMHDCLAIIALSKGDYGGYARHFARFAALKRDPALIRDADAIGRAIRRGVSAVHAEIMRQALVAVEADASRGYAWPALIASVGRQRNELRDILMLARQRRTSGGDAPLVLRVKRAWRSDPEITMLIAQNLMAKI
jgi:tetratricopeptide (TPR) repeat protein